MPFIAIIVFAVNGIYLYYNCPILFLSPFLIMPHFNFFHFSLKKRENRVSVY